MMNGNLNDLISSSIKHFTSGPLADDAAGDGQDRGQGQNKVDSEQLLGLFQSKNEHPTMDAVTNAGNDQAEEPDKMEEQEKDTMESSSKIQGGESSYQSVQQPTYDGDSNQGIPSVPPVYNGDTVEAKAEVMSEEEVASSTPAVMYDSAMSAQLMLRDTPSFTVINVGELDNRYVGNWSPSMPVIDYIGEQDMLLQYLYSQERKYHVSMPLRACGIDPIVFKNVTILGKKNEEESADHAGGKSTPTFFYITHTKQEGDKPPIYELIDVDGDKYLSCASESLDADYLQNVIGEATTAITMHGHYYFRLVGLRNLKVSDDKNDGVLLKTLRLNTYEMSVLVQYMRKFANVKEHFADIGGYQHICFETEW